MANLSPTFSIVVRLRVVDTGVSRVRAEIQVVTTGLAFVLLLTPMTPSSARIVNCLEGSACINAVANRERDIDKEPGALTPRKTKRYNEPEPLIPYSSIPLVSFPTATFPLVAYWSHPTSQIRSNTYSSSLSEVPFLPGGPPNCGSPADAVR